jgi:uncharacterized lipoprotein YddW (UPF0748 family)
VAKAGRYAEACDLAAQARKPLLEAYALAQPSRQQEFRAVWCHSPYGVAGLSWEQAIDSLADFGFNAIVPNMLWAGVAYYPSTVLPTYPDLDQKGDQIAQCLAAAKRRGVQVHVWKVNWNLEHGDTPKEFVEEMRAQGRTQKAPDGSDINWLCPSDDRNFALERDSMLEIARNYAVDGLHFDYIRYPDSRGCYCDGCRQRFEASVGHKVENWPADVQARGTELRQAWLDFRCAQISRLVEAVATEARKIRPGIRISAAVFPNYPSTKEEIGQDWKLWIDRGWLDFVCPMDYTSDSEDFTSYVTRQREVVGGRIPLYPGIGAFILSPDQLIRQVSVARELAPGGFIVFNYDTTLAREHLPLMRMGATAR